MIRAEARQQFTEMILRDDEFIELDRAALLIAAEEYPQLEIETYLDMLDSYARRAQELGGRDAEPLERIMRLTDLLFNDLGFRGNLENYYDARNSLLNDVIDRRRGIPITLSVILIEIGRRIGLNLQGVGMPGHFISKYADDEIEILIDPYNRGQVISEERCREIFEEMYGSEQNFRRSFLSAVTKKQILTRILHNLKSIYANSKSHQKTLSVIERLLLIEPAAVAEIRDRGLTYLSLDRFAEARDDLEKYLQLAPNVADTKEIRVKLGELRRRQARLN
jgi:regulator of sirC expression with transglutaminase-like and TPR domain